MPTFEEHKRLVKTIDTLLVSRGERTRDFYVGSFTAKELLLAAEIPNTENNWRYIIHLMKTHYPDSSWERGSQDEGFRIRIRCRSK